MTVLIGAAIALISFLLGYALADFGSYSRGYEDARDLYSVPAWTYKSSCTTKTKKRKK